MKLTLWQQFSSNHSGGFTVVGKFATAEQAQQAANTLKAILGQIAAFNRTRFETLDHFFDFHPVILTPVEQAIKEQYGAADWTHALDYAYEDNAERHVKQYENLVFVGSVIDSYSNAKPFDTILRQLGAEVTGEEAQQCLLVSCAAPDDAVHDGCSRNLSTKEIGNRYGFLLIKESGRAGEIEREGQQLHISIPGCWLSELDSSTFIFLNRLVSHLEAAGCSNFIYSIGGG